MGVRTTRVEDGRAGVIPVTYINSSAAIKAFVGEHGGIVCTSTNAATVMKWAWERGEKLLMLPDQHLGRNTAFQMGVPLDEMVVWDPNESGAASSAEPSTRAADSVEGPLLGSHAVHGPADRAFRKQYPDGKVIVHPECTFDVVQAADDCGSTEHIISTVKNSPVGSSGPSGRRFTSSIGWRHEVAPARTVLTLDPFGCLCSTMFRVSPNHLLWVLDGLVDGEVHNQIIVPEPAEELGARRAAIGCWSDV